MPAVRTRAQSSAIRTTSARELRPANAQDPSDASMPASQTRAQLSALGKATARTRRAASVQDMLDMAARARSVSETHSALSESSSGTSETLSNLKTRTKRKQHKKRFACPSSGCSKSYARKSDLLRHERNKHVWLLEVIFLEERSCQTRTDQTR